MAETSLENNTLDELVKKEGEEIGNVKIVSSEKIVDKIDESFNTPEQTSYAYGEIGPMPGQPVEFDLSDINNVEKEKTAANERLIQQVALNKLKKQMAELNKKSDSEKIKEYVVKSIIQQQEQDFLNKYGYVMNGQQKRATKRIVETNYKKGKYKITPEQKADILYQLSLASSTKNENENNPMVNKTQGTAQNVKSLMTTI